VAIIQPPPIDSVQLRSHTSCAHNPETSAGPDEPLRYVTTRKSTRGRISAQTAYPYINSSHSIEPDLLGMFDSLTAQHYSVKIVIPSRP
jgi:hypothetical protein